MEYEIIEHEGGLILRREDGAVMDFKVFDLIHELFRQNPRFAKSWLDLAAQYVFLDKEVWEA